MKKFWNARLKPKVAGSGSKNTEASFSDDQTKLKWHLGQVGPTKFDSFRNRKKFFSMEMN